MTYPKTSLVLIASLLATAPACIDLEYDSIERGFARSMQNAGLY